MKRETTGAPSGRADVDAFAMLRRAHYLSLTTYRANGEGVATPVWFAQSGGKLYVRTWPGAGKVRRIARTRRVLVAACALRGRVTGPAIAASARVLEPEEHQAAEAALARKYRFVWWAYFNVYPWLRRARKPGPTSVTYLGITPAVPAEGG